MPRKDKSNDLPGQVKLNYFKAPSDEVFSLQSGAALKGLKIAYETYGEPDRDGRNAVLICHALSGDAHAAGYHGNAAKPGWWHRMIGPGKAFDTDRYFVICSNVLGGCKGTSGPNSMDPDTGAPYGLSFPMVSIGDMVNAQKRLVDHLGIKKLLAVCGGSMGGMQALQWAVSYPDMLESCIPIATTYKHTAQQIAFNEVGRQAIMADPAWNGGDYYGRKVQPSSGLAVARMIGHITYMSNESMEAKFGRGVKKKELGFEFSSEFEVEGYLKYRGDSFVKRFDANSYLYLTKAMDRLDIQKEGKLHLAFRDNKASFLVMAFSSDWLYPPFQSKALVRALKMNGIDVSYCEITSRYGHDSFLLEFGEETRLIAHFLKNVSKRAGVGR